MPRGEGGLVGEALKYYLGRRGYSKRVAQASVIHEWAELVGPQLAKVTTPESVDAGGTLWVRVKSAAWIQELQLMSPTIVRSLAVGGRHIKRIRWMAGTASTMSHDAEYRPVRSNPFTGKP